MKKHTKVNCEVENCKHNDSKKCDLDELDISCTCDDECLDKEETICNNFEKDDSDEEILEIEEIDDMDEKYYEETMIEESSDLDELED